MTKYEVPDGHWDGDDDEDADPEPPITVDHHTIVIDDRRESHGYEYGLDWMFSVEGGVVVGYYLGHWLKGRTQSDPMNSPPWEDVPGFIKGLLRNELNLSPGETVPLDLPDHYDPEGDGP